MSLKKKFLAPLKSYMVSPKWDEHFIHFYCFCTIGKFLLHIWHLSVNQFKYSRWNINNCGAGTLGQEKRYMHINVHTLTHIYMRGGGWERTYTYLSGDSSILFLCINHNCYLYCCCVSIIIVICICPPGALIWLINLFYSILFLMPVKIINLILLIEKINNLAFM
jgi:hypothetical protein